MKLSTENDDNSSREIMDNCTEWTTSNSINLDISHCKTSQNETKHHLETSTSGITLDPFLKAMNEFLDAFHRLEQLQFYKQLFHILIGICVPTISLLGVLGNTLVIVTLVGRDFPPQHMSLVVLAGRVIKHDPRSTVREKNI